MVVCYKLSPYLWYIPRYQLVVGEKVCELTCYTLPVTRYLKLLSVELKWIGEWKIRLLVIRGDTEKWVNAASLT